MSVDRGRPEEVGTRAERRDKPVTLARARIAKLELRVYLAAHDSYSFFAGIGDLIRTGPTGTNVNDIRAVLITEGGRQAE